MFYFTLRHMTCSVAAAVVLFLAGCSGSSKSEVSGAVTYDGKPVDNGAISFTPLEGGPTSGGEIKDGQYAVKDAAPGKNVVQITSQGSDSGPTDMESFQNQQRKLYEAGRKDPRRAMKLRGEGGGGAVPPNAIGNGVTIEIKKGSQTLNFDLQKPKGR